MSYTCDSQLEDFGLPVDPPCNQELWRVVHLLNAGALLDAATKGYHFIAYTERCNRQLFAKNGKAHAADYRLEVIGQLPPRPLPPSP